MTVKITANFLSSYPIWTNPHTMDIESFKKLDPTIQMSMIIAMYIRNEMDDFHSEHLSDKQMRELNPIIRQATYNILKYLKLASSNESSNEKVVAQDIINFQIQSIPDYWELPSDEATRKDA